MSLDTCSDLTLLQIASNYKHVSGGHIEGFKIKKHGCN